MSIIPLYSQKVDAIEIAHELKFKAEQENPKFLLFFVSSKLPAAKISAELKKVFPTTQIAGCTTAGEIISGAMLKNSTVALLIGDDTIEDVAVSVISQIKENIDLNPAFSHFEKHFKTPVSEMDLKKYAGLVLIDGLSGAEEKLIEKIGDRTDITFIGGSSGDDLQFKKTLLFANGGVFSNSAVLVLMKLKNGFDIIKTQSFSSSGKKLIATNVDEANRTVIEFNGKPATEAYSELLGVNESECSSQFIKSPLGLMVNGEPYVRSPQQTKDKNIIFYCNIRQGMELDILKSEDIIGDTRKAIINKLNEKPTIKGIINFNCILRTLELEQKDLCDAYGKLFSSIPTVGFSTYGEAYIGHVNQTATMFVFL